MRSQVTVTEAPICGGSHSFAVASDTFGQGQKPRTVPCCRVTWRFKNVQRLLPPLSLLRHVSFRQKPMHFPLLQMNFHLTNWTCFHSNIKSTYFVNLLDKFFGFIGHISDLVIGYSMVLLRLHFSKLLSNTTKNESGFRGVGTVNT